MSDFRELFSGVNFGRTVEKYCSDQGWRITDVNNDRAVLKFNMASNRSQTLFMIRYETTIEFSVPSMAAFESEDRIPHFLSTLLLKRSAEKKIGFWCIEKIGGKHVYSCMHNAEIRLLDSEYFANVVRALITECDSFEGVLLEMVDQ